MRVLQRAEQLRLGVTGQLGIVILPRASVFLGDRILSLLTGER